MKAALYDLAVMTVVRGIENRRSIASFVVLASVVAMVWAVLA